MYQIYEGDTLVGATNKVNYILYNSNNGCYNICERNIANGFSCLLPREVEIEREDGTTEIVVMQVDCVYALIGKSMKGDEPVGRVVIVDDPIEDEPTVSDYLEALAALGVTI